MESTSGPETEFNDLCRKELLEALKDALPTDTVRPTAWACLWLSDIDKLKELIALSQVSPAFVQSMFETMETSTRIIPTWMQRNRLSSAVSTPRNPSTPRHSTTPQHPSTPLQPPSAQDSRGQKRNSSGQLVITCSRSQRDQCRQRDQKKCVLTNAGEPIEVAHIYPFSMRYDDNTLRQQSVSFWDTLRIFWSKERMDTWYNAIFSNPAKTEACQNLLCLSPNAHAYWERAYFALEPMRISEDKKRLDVQFFWLLSNPHVPGTNILQAPSLSTSDHGPNLARLFDHETMSQICSGDKISLETDDPVSRPLPDFRLLEMQWFLHRVTAMSGAAEPQDDFQDDDSDDDIVDCPQNRWGMYGDDDRDIDTEEEPATYWETSPERL